MHTVDDLLDMIHTEATEEDSEIPASEERTIQTTTFRYDLELVKELDGCLVWKE